MYRMYLYSLDECHCLTERFYLQRRYQMILYSLDEYHRLTGRLYLQGRYQMNFLLFWRVPPSYWKTLSSMEIPNEFCTLLESTAVLLEDPISKEDTKWILHSSGEHHRLTGRLYLQGRYQMNFVLSWWVPLSSIEDSVSTRRFCSFLVFPVSVGTSSSVVTFWVSV